MKKTNKRTECLPYRHNFQYIQTKKVYIKTVAGEEEYYIGNIICFNCGKTINLTEDTKTDGRRQ